MTHLKKKVQSSGLVGPDVSLAKKGKWEAMMGLL